MTAVSPPGPSDRSPRHIATVLFTDIVGSTELQSQLGDVEWQVLLGHHNDLVRAAIDRHGGREISTAGDSFLAVFETPETAIACALEAVEAVREEGIQIRSGIHTGEIVETEGGDVGGIAVTIGARVSSIAGPGEVLVSQTVRDLVRGSDTQLEPRGTHQLKGVAGQWGLYAVEGTAHRAGIVREARVWLGRHRWLAVSVFAALAVVVGLVGLYGVIRDRSQGPGSAMEGSTATPAVPGRSIAVLPFANLSADPENEYFSDGITEEILTMLAKVGGLKVTSRTSVMQYKEHTPNLREIAEALGVSTILEGSVRRSGNRVRITAQLIQASTDEHLWAETYDRELTDIFEIQASVAGSIVSALNTVMTPREREWVNRSSTNSTEAYDLYLRAKPYYNKGYIRENMEQAERLYQRAVEIDPDFALAFVQLSLVHINTYGLRFDRTEERLTKSKEAVDEALRIEPDLPEARVAMGNYYYTGFRDYDRALEEFVEAQRDLPNDAQVIHSIGMIRRRQGAWDEAMAAFETAATLDPLFITYLTHLTQMYEWNRDYPRALEVLDRALPLEPDRVPIQKGWVQFAWTGETARLRSALDGTSAEHDPQGGVTYNRYLLEMLDHDYSRAEEILDSSEWETFDFWFHSYPKSVLLGDVARARGKWTEAREHYETARKLLEKAIQDDPQDPRLRTGLGWVHANLGRRDEAIRLGLKAVELRPDAFASIEYAIDLAAIYAQVGETDLALTEIERLLSIPSPLNRHELRLDPTWNSLWDDTRFQELVGEDLQ